MVKFYSKAKPVKPSQLEADHQRLLKSEKDLRKQMGKQRVRQLKVANEEEDKTIKKLEKLLKIKKTKGAKKIPKMFSDGLDYALEMCLPENIEKMYAAAKEAADAETEVDDGWQEDFAIASGNVEEDTVEEETKTQKAEKKKAVDVKKLQAEKKKAAKLREIEKKYFQDSDLESDLSDVDSEFGNEDGKDSEDHSDDAEDSEELNDSDSDDEAPEEVKTKTKCSHKRKLEKNKNAAAIVKKSRTSEGTDEDDDLSENDVSENDDSVDDEPDGDADALNGSNPDDNSENEDSDNEDLSEGIDGENSDDEKSDGKNTTKKPDIWEDIYGRKRDKEGNVITENAPTKYVPPHLRARLAAQENGTVSEMDADPVRREKLNRLKKVLKGYINRLSEANMHKITTDIDNLYMNNPRHDMNETLTGLICDALISKAIAPERMVLEHALLLAALHANVGSEVGAHILQVLVNKFDTMFNQGVERFSVEDKTLDNVVLILCHMYTFRVFILLETSNFPIRISLIFCSIFCRFSREASFSRFLNGSPKPLVRNLLNAFYWQSNQLVLYCVKMNPPN